MSNLVKIKELNSSFTQLIFNESAKSQQAMGNLHKTLEIERDGWMFDYLVKIGRKSKYDRFYEMVGANIMLVNSGILDLPPIREILDLEKVELSEDTEISEFLENLLKQQILPFDPYPYQLEACKKALNKKRKLSLMCTGSGKSLTISLCLEYFRSKNLKGVLVVPNINLLTQFASDIKSYNLNELHNKIITFGGGSKAIKVMKDSNKELNPGDLVITTWQSLSKLGPDFFKSLDYVICDEVHKFSSKCTSQLVQDSMYSKYKLGFTGTLPDSKSQKLTLMGLFGAPESIITSADLIEQGRGTPIHITGVRLKHNDTNSFEISRHAEYLDKVKFAISIPERTQKIAEIAKAASSKSQGSTLVLFTLIEHGEQLYEAISGEPVSDISRMKELGVYFMSGQSTAKEREQIRQIMQGDPKAILVANYALLSTGVNIKSLRFAIFASPIKSGVVVAQSLGRGIRLNDGKEIFNVYDIVDDFQSTGIFKRQYNARKKIYAKNLFTLDERVEGL